MSEKLEDMFRDLKEGKSNPDDAAETVEVMNTRIPLDTIVRPVMPIEFSLEDSLRQIAISESVEDSRAFSAQAIIDLLLHITPEELTELERKYKMHVLNANESETDSNALHLRKLYSAYPHIKSVLDFVRKA